MGPAPELSEDALLDGRVRLVQAQNGYRVAIDPVFLAAAIPARAGDRVLDIGTGSAAAALCLIARVPDVAVDGIELQEAMCLLAERNVDLNAAGDRLRIFPGDLMVPPPALEKAAYDHVMANPPHLAAGKGSPPAQPERAIAHVEGRARLADWVGFALAMAKPEGTLTFLHRFDRCEELLALLARGAGALQVFPLLSATGTPVKRVLVQGQKGARASVTRRDGVRLHEADGSYSPEARAVLRAGRALSLDGA